mmetsp:Transcript_32107/g.38883  ORF Transcript_32107/g.38883 Transcript_32107/m.38883 type:complete len:82 (+) Transcript_32107:189-434(+)
MACSGQPWKYTPVMGLTGFKQWPVLVHTLACVVTFDRAVSIVTVYSVGVLATVDAASGRKLRVWRQRLHSMGLVTGLIGGS